MKTGCPCAGFLRERVSITHWATVRGLHGGILVMRRRLRARPLARDTHRTLTFSGGELVWGVRDRGSRLAGVSLQLTPHAATRGRPEPTTCLRDRGWTRALETGQKVGGGRGRLDRSSCGVVRGALSPPPAGTSFTFYVPSTGPVYVFHF